MDADDKKRFEQVKETFIAFKHWHNLRGLDSEYEDTFGPDMQFLIELIEKLDEKLKDSISDKLLDELIS